MINIAFTSIFMLEMFILQVSLFSLCLFKFTNLLQFVPPSLTIDVIESNSYIFGFLEDDSTNISKCYYKSNTNISGSFLVVKGKLGRNAKNSKVKSGSNIISNSGSFGLCQIAVDRVNDQGATLWTLQPYDEKTKNNLSEVDFKVNIFYKVPLATEVASVREFGSFYQYLDVNYNFDLCKVTFGKTEIILDIHEKTKSDVVEQVFSLGEGLCGFEYVNASASVAGDWSLTALDDTQKPYRANFKTQFYSSATSTETQIKKVVRVGFTASISCGDKFSQNFCNLYNPKNEFVPTSSSDCYHNIKTVSMNDLGTWKCLVGKFPSMDTIEFRVELIFDEKLGTVKTWYVESSSYASIGCQLHNNNKVENCKMVSPTRTVFNLRPGLAHNRYLAIGTNFTSGTCAIKIEKPLQEYDKGQWRCEMTIGSNRRTGGFIFVENRNTPEYNKHSTITTQIGQPLTIACEVPYSSEYCYIKSPNGTEYLMKDNYETRLGVCSTKIDSATKDDVGSWSCFFARDTGTPDEDIIVNVQIGEVLSYSTKTKVNSGDNVNLMCSSYKLPLNYCRFIAPNSLSYFIQDHQNVSRISYSGKGLKYGECGITIWEAKPSDSGKWTCITRVGGDFEQAEISATMHLEVTPKFFESPNTAIGLCSAAGVILVSSIVGYLGIKKWRRRAHTRISRTRRWRRRTHTRISVSNISTSMDTDSQGDIFSSGPPVSYTTHGSNGSDRHLHQI